MRNRPPINPRRALDDEHPNAYMESDKDFVLNNLPACLWFLEHTLTLRAIQQAKLPPTHSCTGCGANHSFLTPEAVTSAVPCLDCGERLLVAT